MFKMEQKNKNPSFLFFSNIGEKGMKCPYLPRPKEDHFKVVISEIIMSQFCDSLKVLNIT